MAARSTASRAGQEAGRDREEVPAWHIPPSDSGCWRGWGSYTLHRVTASTWPVGHGQREVVDISGEGADPDSLATRTQVRVTAAVLTAVSVAAPTVSGYLPGPAGCGPGRIWGLQPHGVCQDKGNQADIEEW